MEAQAWTAIGLLAATLLGAVFYLGNRIDMLGSEIRTQFQAQGSRIDTASVRIDLLGSEMRSQFQGQGSRIDAIDARIDGLSGRMDALTVRVVEQGAQLADRIYELAVKLDDHLRRHAS